MKKSITLRGFSAYRLWSQLPSLEVSRLPDVIMFAAAIALFYGVITVGRGWVRSIHSVGRDFSQPARITRLRRLFAAAHHCRLHPESGIHFGLRIHRGLQPAR